MLEKVNFFISIYYFLFSTVSKISFGKRSAVFILFETNLFESIKFMIGCEYL